MAISNGPAEAQAFPGITRRCSTGADGPASAGLPALAGSLARLNSRDMPKADRLFAIVDPITHGLAGLCTGPDDAGSCPTTAAPHPCNGLRVVPLRGTPGNGMPFTIVPGSGNACPLAWVDAPSFEATSPRLPGIAPRRRAWHT